MNNVLEMDETERPILTPILITRGCIFVSQDEWGRRIPHGRDWMLK